MDLASGELRIVGRLTVASNLTLLCTISGTRFVYKPIRGERPLWDFPYGTLAGREVASYLISQALGWSLVPETTLRDGPFGAGMVQRWVEADDADLVDVVAAGAIPAGFRHVLDALSADDQPVSLVHADDQRLLKLAVLDVVLNNADRKAGHILSAQGQVLGIDHGICLHEEPKLRTVLWGWADEAIPATLIDDIRQLGGALGASLGDELAEYLTDVEILALTERVQQLVDRPIMPRPVQSPAIPWPPF